MSEQLVSDVERALWMAETEESAALEVPAADLLRELAKLGYAVVKLPDMEVDDPEMATWPVDSAERIVVAPTTMGLIDIRGRNSFMTADAALALAAALIAAAQHVKENRA
jgi:hypothetical protein